ncbi:aromatic ring-hydroxylating oxygenase subunit alpha [Phaeacidiphilus oryzae]|uniref:aromatic ring-hydroxylating oxygenase subunit alpha n=1 Tax=Phaeacidiphilus oryzae TaxID=348818 RepID=UPI000564EB2D|nr:aromatic ring-hydroxylating dioxygenase subunit alpha [Phaeacidiphilus oryzae]
MTPSTDSPHTSAKEWVVEDVAAGTFRVDRTTLIDEAVFEREMATVFGRCWLYVGHESEIPKPGDFKARDVGNRPLIFWHGHDGAKRVLYNSCRHRGALVCRVPEGNARGMSCFYHAWTYNSTGALNGVPGGEGYGEHFDRAAMGLLSPPKVDSYRGFYFVCFDPGAVDLRTYLAGAADYLDLVADQADDLEVVPGAHEYSMDANWKLFVENSLDGYHLLPLHKTYFTYLEEREGNTLDREDTTEALDLGNGHAVICVHGPWARPVARWTPALGEHNRPQVEAKYQELVERHGPERARMIGLTDRNLLVFPNLIINDIMGVVVRTITPTSAGHTRIHQWSLATAGEDPDLRARRLDSYIAFQGPAGLATPDDLEACEACQAGLRTAPDVTWSDISRGMHREHAGQPSLASDELQMRAFWRHWRSLLD